MCKRRIDNRELGHTLALLRIAKHMTIEEVKKKTGLFTDQIAELEKGINIHADVVNKVLELYDLQLIGSDVKPVRGITKLRLKLAHLLGREKQEKTCLETLHETVRKASAVSDLDEVEYEFDGEETDEPELPGLDTPLIDIGTLHNFRPIVKNGLVQSHKAQKEEAEAMAKLKTVDVYEHLWEIWTDGGCVGNKGAWGYILLCDGTDVIRHTGYKKSGATSAYCEYEAVIYALATAVELGLKNVRIYSDMKTLVDILNNDDYIVKASSDTHIAEMIKTIRDNKTMFNSLEFTWVKGHGSSKWNAMIDKMVTEELRLHNIVRN